MGNWTPSASLNTFKAYFPWLGTVTPRGNSESNHNVIESTACSPIWGSGGSCLFVKSINSSNNAEYFRWEASVRQRPERARSTKARTMAGVNAADLQHRKKEAESENKQATEKGSARASVADTRGLARFGQGSRPRVSPV